MKIPMKWLREYVDIPMSAQEYASRMIMTGTAVEGVDKSGEQFDGVVVGRVLTCEDHPNSDHLHVCTVDVGGEAPLQIVCGAPNVSAGQLVPVALEGARLPGGKIKRGKLRGVALSSRRRRGHTRLSGGVRARHGCEGSVRPWRRRGGL